ncbi:hypothetical protein [Sphingomonas bisphenolicum]
MVQSVHVMPRQQSEDLPAKSTDRAMPGDELSQADLGLRSTQPPCSNLHSFSGEKRK